VKIACHIEYQEFEGWYKPNGQKILTHSSNHNIRVEENPEQNEWVLVLTNVETGGTYKCRGAMTKDRFRLRVKCKYTSAALACTGRVHLTIINQENLEKFLFFWFH